MSSDEQIALLKEIRDALISDREQTMKYREGLSSIARDLENAQNAHHAIVLADAKNAGRVRVILEVIKIGVLWLILTAVTK